MQLFFQKQVQEQHCRFRARGIQNSIIGKENENLIHFVDHESELIDCNSCAEPRAYINSLRACSVRWR